MTTVIINSFHSGGGGGTAFKVFDVPEENGVLAIVLDCTHSGMMPTLRTILKL